MPPESPASRAAWRQGLDSYLARRQRVAALRLELAAVRSLAKQRRHAARLARVNRNATTDRRDQ